MVTYVTTLPRVPARTPTVHGSPYAGRPWVRQQAKTRDAQQDTPWVDCLCETRTVRTVILISYMAAEQRDDLAASRTLSDYNLQKEILPVVNTIEAESSRRPTHQAAPPNQKSEKIKKKHEKMKKKKTLQKGLVPKTEFDLHGIVRFGPFFPDNFLFLFVLFFFTSFLFMFFFVFWKFFTFGQVKGNARCGRSRHRPIKVFEFVKLIFRPWRSQNNHKLYLFLVNCSYCLPLLARGNHN